MAWGKSAEFAQRFLGKGRKVYVEGRLQTRSWDDQQSGQKRYSTEIVADQLTALDSGKREEQGQRPAQAHGPAGDEGFADGVPF